MRETEYAYAVARIRVNETSLLTTGDIEQLIAAVDVSAAERILADKGWSIPEGTDGPDAAEQELAKSWALIADCVPDSSLLEALVVANDFFNLKAAIKCVFSGLSPERYYLTPALTDSAVITEAIRNADFALLPTHLAGPAQQAYEAVSRLESGQLAECILDRAGLEARLACSRKSQSALMVKIADLLAAAANIKIALRCRAMEKNEQFALDSMCECSMDNRMLLAHAGTPDELAEYLKETPYSFLAPSIKKGFADLEKECDNVVVSWLEPAKYAALGPDPVIAYFYAKQAETKNVRIILSAKAGGVPAESILKRVRNIYV